MPNMGFGILYNGKPALRIAFDNSTDLINESITSFGKFQFDSSNAQLGYIYDIVPLTYLSSFTSGGYLGAWWYFNNYDLTAGSSSPTSAFETAGAITRYRSTSGGTQSIHFFQNWWNFGYLPILEGRIPTGAGLDTFNGPTVNYSNFGSTNGYVDSYTAAGPFFTANALVDSNIFSGISGNARECYGPANLRGTGTNVNWLFSTFQLPARNDALPDFSATPVSGQIPLLYNPTVARLALPGRDVTDSNVDHYIFHENKIPAKIMAAGDVEVPGSGTATINCKLPLTNLTYMDFHVKRKTDTEFWNPPYYDSIASDKSLQFTYKIQSNSVLITNGNATDITIRYVVFADSGEAETTGGKKVFLKGNDGTRDYVQIKRPGSSDLSPNLNDIIVDTRLAYMPILAQGFLAWQTDFPTAITGSNRFKGERMATVSFSNPSPALKIFVKQTIVFPSNCTNVTVRNGYHRVFCNNATWAGIASGDSSWANIHDTSVDFYMAGDNPIFLNSATGATNYNPDTGGTNRSALGLRYYIFGIPQSL
ncbi:MULTISPECIES: hypothetical protein [unclassified Mesorhizobium]|uniref:hypothetical protein n=1 Tax=unclassified Mesorhizobium TaxID=325217 RepID=UPI000F763878|nr:MULTISPECIES: hypothetical protein [unclassified Mesorhizobium]AZO54869.1 hypothetical protein EJ077_16485 [Mesorhizobium sp. M8A.F.Ca.ET.057.01.1.1]RWE44149.1 MAG: hypothetical protein EOS80_19580 [Mesorhizobium sp.]